MCWAAAIPLVAGAALQGGSYLMNQSADSDAWDKRNNVLQGMFDRNNSSQADMAQRFNTSLNEYSPGAQATAVGNETKDIVNRSGEQYAAAQASAPDHTEFGTITPGYTRDKAAYEVQRASDAVERAKNYAAVAAPEHVRQQQGFGQQKLGEEFNQQNQGNAALSQLDQIQYGGITPQYSPWAGLMSGVGGALTTQGIANGFASGWSQPGAWKGFKPPAMAKSGGDWGWAPGSTPATSWGNP